MECRAEICHALGGLSPHLILKYLGLPLVIGRSKKQVFHYVLVCVRSRSDNWKNIFLSQAGKGTLIRAVIDALPVYVMSCFKLPKGICYNISRSAGRFLWGQNEVGNNKIHWKAWHKMAKPKDREVKSPYNASWMWRSWLEARYLLQLGACYQVGDGETIKILESPWLPGLSSFLPSPINPSNFNLTWVCELMNTDGCSWNTDLVHCLFGAVDAMTILKQSISHT